MARRTSAISKAYIVLVAAVLIIAAASIYYFTRPKEKIKLEWWDLWGPAQLEWGEEMEKEFEETHPDVDVIIVDFPSDEEFKTKLEAAFAAGEPPAVFRTLGGGILKSYVDGGHVEDITGMLNEDWALEQIPRATLRQSTFNGRHYAVPFTLWAGHFYINKELFKRAGVEIPPIDKVWTWDEFMDAIRKFKEHGIIPIAVGGKEKWELSFYYMYLVDRIGGSKVFTCTINRASGYSFNAEPFVKAGYYFKQIVDAGAFEEGFLGASYDEAYQLFITGKAAMWLNGPWVIGDLRRDAPDFPLDIINFPTVPDGRGDPHMLLGAVQLHYAVAKNFKHKDVALEFLRFITKKENVIRFAVLTQDLMAQNVPIPEENYDPVLLKVMKSVSKASFLQMAYDEYSPPKFAEAHLDALAELAAGTITPEEMASIQEEVAKELADAGILPVEELEPGQC